MSTLSFVYDKESTDFVINRLHGNTNLSEWEKNFIESIKTYRDGGGFLSDKQAQKLSDLWEKY